MDHFQVYKDIQARTKGEIYIGVVGPVRTGKSTFIRRFMEQMALPALEESQKKEVQDQLPVSGSGKIDHHSGTQIHSQRGSKGDFKPGHRGEGPSD